jgi:hypothetical protein
VGFCSASVSLSGNALKFFGRALVGEEMFEASSMADPGSSNVLSGAETRELSPKP